MNHTQFIHQSLQEVSDVALRYFGKVSQEEKVGDNNQVLTQADLAIGKKIVELITKQFPDHNVIDEEAGVIDKGSEWTWVVDPIDGTSNFANGSPLYGISVGLLLNDKPHASGVALPSFHEIYLAEKGMGATCNDKSIHVVTESNLMKTLVAYGIDGHQEEPERTVRECETLAQIVLNIRNLRSSNSVLDSAWVAKGVLGACLNQTSKIWDNVAQQILIEEAGGVYTDFWGKPIDYEDPLTKIDLNYTYCAAPQALHEQLQKLIRDIDH